jgi:tRNA-specific 2-thiouridylase
LPGYTIGQRKGLGISGAVEPMFVLELDHAQNTLVVGTEAELGRDRFIATNVNWTLDAPVVGGAPAQCKIRYKALPVDCTLHPRQGGDVEVICQEKLRDITPGQGAVFFNGDHCLGGGVIKR